MLRPTPPVRALWERVRRPLTMFAIGAAVAAPASAFMLRDDVGANTTRSSSHTDASVLAGTDGADVTSTATRTSEAWSAARVAGESTLRLSKLYNVPLGLATEVHQAAKTAGITPRVAFGLVRTESAFRRTAVSPVGAIGYTQVMPGTAKWMRPGTNRSDLFDPQTNLSIGFKYLKGLIDRYDGNVRLALTAYNRGPGTVDRLVQRGRNPENGYASMVLADPNRVRLTTAQKQVAAVTAASDFTPAARNAPVPMRHALRYVKHSSRHVVKRHYVRPARHAQRAHHGQPTRHAQPTRRHAGHGLRRHRR